MSIHLIDCANTKANMMEVTVNDQPVRVMHRMDMYDFILTQVTGQKVKS